MATKIENLAETMNVSEKDLTAFVACLKVWLDKGYTLEEAIDKHMVQIIKLAENAHNIPKTVAVETFYN